KRRGRKVGRATGAVYFGAILNSTCSRIPRSTAAAVREHIRPALLIMLYISPNGHRLHRRARIPTAAWSTPVAAQNRITRSSALSLVVAFAMAYSRRSLPTRPARQAHHVFRTSTIGNFFEHLMAGAE